MSFAKDAFAYLSSFTGEHIVARYSSSLNPVIEVALVNGRYQLNSENVNYSYGPLHDAFRKYFRQDPPHIEDTEEILILGFGGGSVATILREEYQIKAPITGVEADKEVIAAANEHFNIQHLGHLSLIEEDALNFVNNNTGKWKLIIVDIYLDALVPPVFETQSFLKSVKQLLLPGGKVVFNKFAGNLDTENELHALELNFKQTFDTVHTFKIPVNKKAPNYMITGLVAS
ncbi:hypothetical protein MASR1M74_10530 [Lentimicrobium sp.]